MTQVTGTLKAPRKEYAPGDVIGGKYGLLRLLGEGGMGSVWVAENMALKANVALKLIRADVAEASANERFLSEARLAARLQHASIVRVFDFGKTEQDEPYIVMELLEGETLGQRLTRLGAIDPMELCQTLLPIVDALHSAHGHGVIHRDLKPDNVFIAKADGGGSQPKLLDFGIAKLRGEGPFHSTKLTQAGTLIGSPDYMSPEQARGETDLDPRSDVWALCVLAYECLVGKPPFHGDNYNALLWAIIHDEPVPITVFQAGDAELWRILKTGFAKDRNARWESARKLGEALAAWLESHGVMEDICNRSLQASWLPAERPTRPELQPFDPLAGAPTYRGSSHDSMMPAPTLAAMRRPRAMSLWFAGLGLATLLGAWVLSKTDAIGIPTVEAENTGSKVGTLLPKSPSLPGPAKETLDEPAQTQPVGATEPVRAQEPIAAPQVEGNSWKQNHDPNLHQRDPALVERMEKSMRGPGNSPNTGSNGASGTVAANDDPAPAQRPTASGASSNTSPQHRPAPAKPAPKAAPKRAAPKRAVDPSDNEVDFGI